MIKIKKKSIDRLLKFAIKLKYILIKIFTLF